MKKITIIILIIFSFFTISVLARENLNIILREDINIDEYITQTIPDRSKNIEKILVAQIIPENKILANDTANWISIFHYYSITRLGFPDIPFNYIVDREGNIYEGMNPSEGIVPFVDTDKGLILIGYLSETSDITNSAQNSIGGLIEYYSFNYGISRQNVLAVDLGILHAIDGSPSFLTYEPCTTRFSERFTDTIKDLKYSEESNLEFSGSILELEYERNIYIGDMIEVKFKLKNEDYLPWHIEEGSLFLSTLKNKESIFAVNQVWESFSKPFSLEEQTIKPGEEIELDFVLNAKHVLPGKYVEEFEFVMIPKGSLKGTEFKLEFEVKKGNREIVEIQRTGTGELTVYSCPGHDCDQVAGVKMGSKHVVLETKDNWHKIHVDGVEGWVISNFAKIID